MGASLLGLHPGTSLTFARALQSWCKQSQKLGASFAQEVSLRHEAARFVMINVYDEEEPEGEPCESADQLRKAGLSVKWFRAWPGGSAHSCAA